jgi:hypothetical protein
VEPAPPDFGWGSVQVLGCAALLFAAGLLAGTSWRVALVARPGPGASSTAIALRAGRAAPAAHQQRQAGFSILLFQDVAAIPILALLPLLAVGGAAPDAQNGQPAGGRGEDRRRDRRHRAGRPAACARCCAGSAGSRTVEILHRRGAAAGGRHRGADATGGHVHGARRLPGRAAGGK